MARRTAIALTSLLAGCLSSPPAENALADADPLACPGNLINNPSFEDGTAGWLAAFGSVRQIADGALGDAAGEMCSDGTHDAGNYYSLDDSPESVENPKLGETYALTVSVRAGAQDGPQNLTIAVREVDEAGDPHPSGIVFSPDGEWRPVETSLIVQSAAPMSVDVYVASSSPVAGNCFQVDAFCLVRRDP